MPDTGSWSDGHPLPLAKITGDDMFGIRILMLLSRATSEDKLEADKKWKDGEIIIRHNLDYEMLNVEEVTEIDARIGVQNYMDQEFFSGEISEFERYQTLLHNRECRIIVKPKDKGDETGSEGFLKLWFVDENKMREYEPEASRLFLHLGKERYESLVTRLAEAWYHCVIQARIFAIDGEGEFDGYMKKESFEYTRELKLGAAFEFRFVYRYGISEFRYHDREEE